MPDPDNNSINRQPIIVNLRKRERAYDGQYDAGNSPGTVIVSLYGQVIISARMIPFRGNP